MPVPDEGGSMEKVSVRDAAAVVAGIDAKGRKLVVKIDAEGAEYEIMRRLAEKDQLGRIDVLFIEWHEREGCDPAELRTILADAGFRWFERQHGEVRVGMITAFR
jgi:hypothetical protein